MNIITKIKMSVIKKLDETVKRMISDQVMDKNRPDYGGFFSTELGFASPYHVGNARYITLLGYAYTSDESEYFNSADILNRIKLSVSFQNRCQRDSGFFDLPFTNFDSPTDTSFSVAMIGRVLYMARKNVQIDDAELEKILKQFLISSAEAVSTGGFHTPNHRWVVTAAMSQVVELFPELDLSEAIESYLAEGIDVNEDGDYSERSNGGYNAVCNTHLIQAAEALKRPEILQSVRKNLQFMKFLFHDDWTVVTSTSLRQDKGKKVVPSSAADGFLYMGMTDNDSSLLTVAKNLLEKGGFTNFDLIYWLARHPEWLEAEVQTDNSPESFTRYFPSSGVWRVRRDKMSATLATEVTGAFSVKYGEVQLRGLRLHSPYFAGARFKGKTLSVDKHGAKLILKSDFFLPQLPGYWKPLGKKVPYKDLPFNNLDKREVIPRPEFIFILSIQEIDNGFELSIKTEGGMEKVPFILDFLFEVPGDIELENASFPGAADAVVFHKSGNLTYRVGEDAITIGPGFYKHRMSNPPGIDPAHGALKVTMTDWTQVERKIILHYGRWTESDGLCFSDGGPVQKKEFSNL